MHCNSLATEAEQARAAPRGDLRLFACRDCAHVFNAAFDAARLCYDDRYETSLFHSGHFREWATALAERLRTAHVPPGSTVVELGCGRGDFLALLAEPGRHRALGFDTSYDGRHDARPGVTIERSHESPPGIADLLVCRHVLEHVEDPYALLGVIREGLAPAGVAYVEVPDVRFTLAQGGVFDLIYEHCGYFSAPSLARALTLARLRAEAPVSDFGGQFLAAEARRDQHPEPPATDPDVATILALVDDFARTFERTVDRWRALLAARTGHRLALWGAGSKGVTFLNVVPGAGAIATVIDVNPQKQDRHVPGGGQRIVPPSALREHPVDAIVLLNPNYRDEIAATLTELGSTAELLT